MPRIGEKITLEFVIPGHWDDYENMGEWDDCRDAKHFFDEVMDGRELNDLFEYAGKLTHSTEFEVKELVAGAIVAALNLLEGDESGH